MNNSQITATKQRLDLLTEIEQTPEEYISDLLQIVRLFRQSILIKKTSVNAWDNAINQINNNEQKETLKIIESLEGVSI
jgi:hypothetical protein